MRVYMENGHLDTRPRNNGHTAGTQDTRGREETTGKERNTGKAENLNIYVCLQALKKSIKKIKKNLEM